MKIRITFFICCRYSQSAQLDVSEDQYKIFFHVMAFKVKHCVLQLLCIACCDKK